MNKIKRQIFLCLWLILTIFLVSILFILNTFIYINTKNQIVQVLKNVHDNKNIYEIINDSEILDDQRAFSIANFDIVYCKLNKKNKISEIANYSNNVNLGNESNEVLKSNVENIIKQNEDKLNKVEDLNPFDKKQKRENIIYCSNLFVSKYSYIYDPYNCVILIQNKYVRYNLYSYVLISIVMFFALEIVIIFISRKLTIWLVKPVFETINKQKEFIADASHELKTPLAVILANAESIEQDKTNKKYLKNIISQVSDMSNLINDLLNLARLENEGANEHIKEKINLSLLIENTVLTFESLAFEEKKSLLFDIQDDLEYVCNSSQIKQLVKILIDNALKYSNEGAKIEVELYKQKKNIYFIVANQGMPISKEDYTKIFERFYRADKSRTTKNQYGLGLSIARNIVISNNGKISVRSENGFNIFTVIFNL